MGEVAEARVNMEELSFMLLKKEESERLQWTSLTSFNNPPRDVAWCGT